MSQAWKNDARRNVFDLDCKDIPEKRFTASARSAWTQWR